VLQDVVTRALRLWPAQRAESPADNPFASDPRYQLISFQGESALARIYRVDDRQLNRVMLLFMLHCETPRDTARSLRIATELSKAGLIQHRNLVSVQRVAKSQSRLLVVLDDVSGISLGAVLAQTGPLPTEAAMLVAKRIAAAQHRLNEAGVLLRQIDPEQVLFLPDGAVKLLPLALSSEQYPASQSLAECSAEQWLAADRRTEVAAYGELLQRLLGAARANLPEAWRAVLDACTEPAPTTRYASMAEVVAALDAQ
jgi:serine/threonine protein kinase